MKIAIVGCGQIADAHIQEVRKIPDTDVVAVCDLNLHLAKQAAVRYQIAGCYTDIELMLKETNPDVVHITTPPASHYPIAIKVLNHGSHIYMEKPFTRDLPEAQELVNLADKTGKLICAGHNSVCDPAYQQLLAAHKEDRLGDIVHLISVMGYNLDGPFGSVAMGDPLHWLHKLPGGLAQNNISHPISLILGLMSGDAITVNARGYRLRKKRFNDIRDAFFDEIRADFISKTVSAHLVFSSLARPVQTCITAFGTKCAAFVSLDSRTVRYTSGANFPGPFAKVQWSYHDAKETFKGLMQNIGSMSRAKLHYFIGMNELIKRFYAAIEGKQNMPVPMTEALRVTAVMDGIIRECKKNDIAI